MRKKNTPSVFTLAAVVIGILVLLVFRSIEKPAPPPADTYSHLVMGNPSGATDDPNNPDNYLMRKPYFAISYNNSKGTPNWVSWCLRQSDLGPAPRAQFFPDPDLPSSFKQIHERDYNKTGFDRGHLCPRSDRTNTKEAAIATFVMSNIMPQSPACNQKAWADLENYCRDLVTKHHQTLYIIAGPQGRGGTGSEGHVETIADGKVTVPARCWKVVLALDGGTGAESDIGKVGSGTRIFAVIMPNDETVGHGWAKYRKSAKEVEELTGYRFFDRVPAGISAPLMSRVDHENIPTGRSHHKDD